MLRSVEITAEVAVTAQENLLHNLRWERGLELSLDCFLCERTDRTAIFEWGSPTAICTAEPEAGRHRTAARIEALECAIRAERQSLRAVVDSWWSPFIDGKCDAKARPLGSETPVHLTLSYFCRREHRSGTSQVHTGMTTPTTLQCQYCNVALATCEAPPSIRLLS